jgi:hypothetical protein
MTKLGILSSITALIAAFAFAVVSPANADDAPATPPSTATPCVHKDFKTDLVKNACTQGGQPAAKDAMKKFMKDAKIKTCNQCHSKLAPNYDMKDDAVDQFKKAGGK